MIEPLIGIEKIQEIIDAPSVATIYELRRRTRPDPLPCFVIAGRLKARPSELAAWIERQRRTAR
jgi:hypothetical protein